MSTPDKFAFIRCHEAVHVISKFSVQCIESVITNWHSKNQSIGTCANPKCTPKLKCKPKQPTSCKVCISWGNALEAVEYTDQTHRIFSSLAWININPTVLSQDPVEVAKAFGIKLPKGDPPPSKFKEFDTASLLLMMMKFGEFHGRDHTEYQIIKKVSEYDSYLII